MPTNNPQVMMMTSDNAPVLWTCSTTRLGRNSAPGSCASTRPKNSATEPTVVMNSRTLSHSSRRKCMLPSTREQVFVVIGRRIVEGHRSVGEAVDELVHDLRIVILQLDEAAGGGDLAAGDDVARVREDRQLLDVVRHDDAGDAERVVHLPHQPHDHAHGDRIEAG